MVIIKGKVTLLILTSVVPSVTRLVSMEADGAPFTPLPLSALCFTGIQSYGYTDQRKIQADVEVTKDRTGDLSLRKPRTSQLSHDCSYGPYGKVTANCADDRRVQLPAGFK